MLNLNQLRVFYEVARSLNFSVAAERLSVTQPAVSKQIKALGDYYDIKLFTIRNHKVHLTDEGKKIYVYASRIFELERQLEEMIGGFINLEHGSLRIGTTKSYAKMAIPVLLSSFQLQFPHVIIELDEGSSLSMARSVLDFKNSLAIVAKVETDPDIVFKPLSLEEVVLVASPHCSLVNNGSITFEDLNGYPLIMKEIGSGTRRLIDERISRHNIKPNIIAHASNMDFIKGMVSKNKGVAFVVKCAVEKELSDGDLVSIPIIDKPLLLDISIAYLKDYELPPTAKMFLEYLLPFTEQKSLPLGIYELMQRIAGITGKE